MRLPEPVQETVDNQKGILMTLLIHRQWFSKLNAPTGPDRCLRFSEVALSIIGNSFVAHTQAFRSGGQVCGPDCSVYALLLPRLLGKWMRGAKEIICPRTEISIGLAICDIL